MKRLFLLLTLTISYWLANAQIPKEPFTVQGPNAASLGQYGEVPVSLFTGLPNIEVPLYSVQEGGITVPIFLSYHASGFRPDMHPGWVGMGWNLNAGGAINRTVHDEPDDYYNNYSRYGAIGYYYVRGLLNRSDWHTFSVLQGVAQSNSMKGDTEPDEFSFNFNGYNGKFYLTPDGSWKVKCDKPVTVKLIMPNQTSPFLDVPSHLISQQNAQFGVSKTFAGFIITTEDGTEYTFGGSTTAIEYEVNLFDQNEDEWSANSWNLSQIVRNDGRKLLFKYERTNSEYIAQVYPAFRETIDKRTVSTNGTFGSYLDPNCSSFEKGSGQTSIGGKLISPIYLASIQTTLATIYLDRETSTELRYDELLFNYKYNEFEKDPNHPAQFLPFLQGTPGTASSLGYLNSLQNLKWKKLSTIRVIQNSTSQKIREFSFKYNDVSTERLTLLNVTEKGIGGAEKPPYRFGYNKYHNLPPYIAQKYDHWGFFNNRPANFNYSAHYASRESNPDSAVYLAGMLTKIIYPLGGVTDFLYEQHTYGKQLDEDRFSSTPLLNTSGNTGAGGVRIKKITSYSLDNPQQKLSTRW